MLNNDILNSSFKIYRGCISDVLHFHTPLYENGFISFSSNASGTLRRTINICYPFQFSGSERILCFMPAHSLRNPFSSGGTLLMKRNFSSISSKLAFSASALFQVDILSYIISHADDLSPCSLGEVTLITAFLLVSAHNCTR